MRRLLYTVFAIFSITCLQAQTTTDTLKPKQLADVTVIGQARTYKPDTTVLITRLPMRTFEAPQQVQIISRSLMNDQMANQLSDVYKNSSGVIAANGTAWNGTIMRGFNIGSENYLYNGQRGDAIGQDIVPFLPQVEEVQILKGASGVLFGEGGLGGTINMVTKKPLFYNRYEISVTGGNFGTFRTTFDATSALNKNKTLAYRISGGYEDAGSFMTNFYNKTFIAAPSVTYKNKGTEINWTGTYTYDKRNVSWQNGVPAIGRNLFVLPRGWSSNDPNDYAKHNSYLSQLQVKQKLANRLYANAQYLFSQSNWVGSYWIHKTQQPVDNAGNIDRYRENNIGNVTYKFNSVNLFVNYDIQTGNSKHSFVLGYDFNKRADLYPESQDVLFANYNVYTNQFNTIDYSNLTTDKYLYAVNSKSNSGYFQYLFNWNKKLNILLGGRYQKYGYDFEFTAFGSSPYKDTSDTKVFVPRVGASYLINENFSVFAGYNQGFTPQSSNNPMAGGPFPAERGNQYEAGVKAELLKKRLSTTLSYYQITKTNVLTPDVNDQSGNRLTTAGEVKSKGVELDIMGSLADNWKIIANMGYNEVKVSKSSTKSEIGKRFRGSIPVVGNFWTIYKFTKKVDGLKIGAGLNYSGKRLIVVDPTLEAPAYTLLNAMVGYEKGNIDVSLNVNNITNTDYVAGSYSINYNFRGAPTNFLLTMRYRFSK